MRTHLPSWLMTLLALSLAASAAGADGAPRGPAIGSVRYVATIDAVGGVPDADDYVGPLVEGETLRVRVAATARSELRPEIRLVGPDGVEVAAEVTSRHGGRLVVAQPVTIPRTGVWTVRVAGRDATEGAYQATLRVAAARPRKVADVALGGGAPLASTLAFAAADGGSLSMTVAASGAPVAIRSVAGPAGEALPLPSEAVTTRRNRTTLADLPLRGGTGVYTVTVGIDDGEARCSLTLRVAPPPRPHGTVELAAPEPYLAPRAEPIEAEPGSIVRLPGARFAAGTPHARVFFDDTEAAVAAIAPTGAWIDAVAPPGAEGTVADVTVQNPDGQSVTRRNWFRFAAQGVLDVASLEPAAVALQQGATRRFTVTLTRRAPPLGADVELAASAPVGSLPARVRVVGGDLRASFDLVASATPVSGRITATHLTSVASDVVVVPPAALASVEPAAAQLPEGAIQRFTVTLTAPAPPAGIDVALVATGSVGTLPEWVHVPGESASASFDLAASPVRAAGVVRATASNTVEALVTVAPPSTIDLTGWRLEQANSARSLTIPSGTVLLEGGYLVIGRNVTKAEFETYWGRTLGANVVYVNGADQWPSINGAETFELKNAAGVSIDGPSVAMPAAAASVVRRTPGAPAGAASSWTIAASTPVSNATPGGGQSAAAAAAGVYVSEFADASGSGNYVYEFVEIYFDRFP